MMGLNGRRRSTLSTRPGQPLGQEEIARRAAGGAPKAPSSPRSGLRRDLGPLLDELSAPRGQEAPQPSVRKRGAPARPESSPALAVRANGVAETARARAGRAYDRLESSNYRLAENGVGLAGRRGARSGSVRQGFCQLQDTRSVSGLHGGPSGGGVGSSRRTVRTIRPIPPAVQAQTGDFR